MSLIHLITAKNMTSCKLYVVGGGNNFVAIFSATGETRNATGNAIGQAKIKASNQAL